ncbi:TATA-binding protein-associated factor 2N [Drosophila eugracilis]|uniref:TATA-binding protein-associated factor 2N n=1 Tax=Drosophila eugracilis TaxID=29029 RepID=UPI0007E5C56E|nr:TATA-binding protein-associated factor 2N [Drosophila eugracilis]
METTAASVVYANPFYAQNYSSNQAQSQLQNPHQIFHSNYMISSEPNSGLELGLGSSLNPETSPQSVFNDIYRFENGGGDASGSLMLGQEDDHFCGEETPQSTSISPSSSMVASTSCSCPTTSGESLNLGTDQERDVQLNQCDMVERGEMTTMDDNREQDGDQRIPFLPCMGGNTSYMVFPRTAADYMPRLALPRHPTYLNIGQEQYIIQPETIFVLGMRLNVTKNDIILFFGKLGLIRMDEANNKPKIFVYKNKMTGRSKGEATITYVSSFSAQAAISCLSGAKFMGQTLTVLPAYLSTRRGSVRYSYPREMNTPENQRRQRALRWKPASDNWVCMLCRNSNFVWRSCCNRCRADKLTASQDQGAGTSTGASNARRWRPQKSDWPCGFCFNLNFWYRVKCNRCHAARSDGPPSSETEENDTWELLLNQPNPE